MNQFAILYDSETGTFSVIERNLNSYESSVWSIRARGLSKEDAEIFQRGLEAVYE